MRGQRIPVLVIDDTPIKLRGVCEFVEETETLSLQGQCAGVEEALRLVEEKSGEQRGDGLRGWLVLSDLRLGMDNGVELGRRLLEVAPGLRIVIYTQDPSWTLAAEVFRQEYARQGRSGNRRRERVAMGLHGYVLFHNILPDYLERIGEKVVGQGGTYIDEEVLGFLLERLRGERLTPRQEECAALIAQGLSNEEIAARMGFLNAKGLPNIGPVENLVSELYTFFTIFGVPSDPGRRVLLAHAYEAYAGLRS